MNTPAAPQPNRTKVTLVVLAVSLFTASALGLLWLFSGGGNAPVGAGWYVFSFAAGLSMIVLPCTLPLAFVIVPLSMGKGPMKGLGIALSFGTGVALMLSLYGIIAAVLGKVAIGSMGAPLEVVKNWMYFGAGLFAYLFALGELGFIKMRMPTYTGAAPAFIQKQQDYVKAFCLGLFLGNIGVGCPHPATPVILTRIAVSGDVFYGWLLFFVHAVGRVLPLLLLAILGILGVNALTWLVARKDKVERATGWGMVFVAGFILVLGLFSHDWWVASGQHTLMEEFTQEEKFLGLLISRLNLTGAPHAHGMPTGTGLFGLPLALGNWVLVFLWTLPMWWWLMKKTGQGDTDEDKKLHEATSSARLLGLSALTIAFVTLFVFVLPDRFYFKTTMGDHHSTMMTSTSGDHAMASGSSMMSGMMNGMSHAANSVLYHEESAVTSGLVVDMTSIPSSPSAGKSAQFSFRPVDRPSNTPVVNLEINHEKLMHVIGVRNDMNEFFHIHPNRAAGSSVFATSYTFAKPGTYKVWSEVTQGGINHVVGHKEIVVSGEGSINQKDVVLTRSVIAGDYQVGLGYSGALVKGKDANLTFDIHDAQGREIETENYLGVPMHLAIISDDLKEFIHAHPDDGTAHAHAAAPRFIPQVLADEGHAQTAAPAMPAHGIAFHVTFPKAGMYRLYAQFRPKGSTLTTDEAIVASFWVDVKDTSPLPISPWWLLLFASIGAIAVLVKLTIRYLTVEPVVKKKEGSA